MKEREKRYNDKVKAVSKEKADGTGTLFEVISALQI